MDAKEYFDTIDLDEIKRFITDKQEENLTLEFKTATLNAANSIEDDRKNLSKALSGFSNSNGGIIIWGIKAKQNKDKQDVADELKPISELTKFLNFLNRNEGQSVVPLVIGVIHVKIEDSNDSGYIKTYVPKSENAPHMALMDKHYYKRSGDSFYRCEHFDIVDLFSRKKSPILDFSARAYKVSRNNNFIRYEILVSLINNSSVLAKHCSLGIKSTPQMPQNVFGVDGNRNTGLHCVRNNIYLHHNYETLHSVIHPVANIAVDVLNLDITNGEEIPDIEFFYSISAENMKLKTGFFILKKEEIDIFG